MTPILWLILIPKFHSSTQLYGCHNLDILIAFPIIATETFLSGSPNFMDETSDKKKNQEEFLLLKGRAKYLHVSRWASKKYFGKSQA